MNKWIKYILIAFSVFVMLILIVGVVAFRALPSPSQIAQILTSPRNIKQVAASTVAKPDGSVVVTPDAKAAVAHTPAAAEKPSIARSFTMLEKMTDPEKPMVTFCDSLASATLKVMNDQISDKRLEQTLFQEDLKKKDPLIESFMPVLKFNMSQPHMLEAIDTVKAAVKGDKLDDTLTSKASFYRTLYNAYKETVANKAHSEELSDRTYRMYIMAKAVAVKPELLQNPEVMTYCRDIEAAINNGVPQSFTEERDAFNEFMQASGVNPESIGYDPNYKTEIKVHFDSQSLTLKGGWYDRLLKSK